MMLGVRLVSLEGFSLVGNSVDTVHRVVELYKSWDGHQGRDRCVSTLRKSPLRAPGEWDQILIGSYQTE